MAGKVIVRIKGGLGNQLFCYAAARRLSLTNNAELVIDDVTGFRRDRQYQRQYMLDHFHIGSRKATSAERLEPFERYRRGIAKWISRRKPFEERYYLEQEGLDFDERLLAFKVNSSLYLDGLWQSEGYFKDVEQTIRQDLRIIPPADRANQIMAEMIRNTNAVALHVRSFDSTNEPFPNNLSTDYYSRAIALMDSTIDSPRYFLFSDTPEPARSRLRNLEDRVTLVAHNEGTEKAYADLWLMTQCRHYITANSTFSWWGAWLGGEKEKVIICPALKITKGITAWNFAGHIPDPWLKV